MATFDPFGVGDDLHQHLHHLPNPAWSPTLQNRCHFPPEIFTQIALNLIKNPNITSKLLFRADILYDCLHDGSPPRLVPASEKGQRELRDALQEFRLRDGDFPGFEIKQTIVRMMIPRNPQLDKPIAQTCQLLQSVNAERQENLVVYIPHTSSAEGLPWYHPRGQAVACLHSWPRSAAAANVVENHGFQHHAPPSLPNGQIGAISVHYRLFPFEPLPLSDRLVRTAYNLLSVIHRHGQGTLAGYTKRVHHNQLISQQRVQDTYTELKLRHADRLRNNWVEQTEPSKHVFEELGIAAFLIELWKDMYPGVGGEENGITPRKGHVKDAVYSFPGFVDLGCGNGVLVDVLIREGYHGWGLDARRRKTWATFTRGVQDHLKELILIPQPLFEMHADAANHGANGGLLSQIPGFRNVSAGDGGSGQDPVWHNGVFPMGTFIISNHADELTPWTPLLASISSSPFLAIPCCSHNLSGQRFRAPSVYNSYSADRLAPSYFAANVTKSKSVAIKVACAELLDDNDDDYHNPHHQPHQPQQQPQPQAPLPPQQGDLKDLRATQRSKQPSAYSSLCDWVSHLAGEVGYAVEREVLRLPSTRNMGIVGRARLPGFEHENESNEMRMERVKCITGHEGADGNTWVERARGLVGGSSSVKSGNGNGNGIGDGIGVLQA